jgi:hypothetical protein
VGAINRYLEPAWFSSSVIVRLRVDLANFQSPGESRPVRQLTMPLRRRSNSAQLFALFSHQSVVAPSLTELTVLAGTDPQPHFVRVNALRASQVFKWKRFSCFEIDIRMLLSLQVAPTSLFGLD